MARKAAHASTEDLRPYAYGMRFDFPVSLFQQVCLHPSPIPFLLAGIVFNFMTSNFIESKAINSESVENVEYSNGVCNTRMLSLMSVSVRRHYKVAWNTNRFWKELAIIRRRLLFTMESFLLVFPPILGYGCAIITLMVFLKRPKVLVVLSSGMVDLSARLYFYGFLIYVCIYFIFL